MDAFPFCEESIREIDAVCDQLLKQAGACEGVESEETSDVLDFASGEAMAQTMRYERYRNQKKKYREI